MSETSETVFVGHPYTEQFMDDFRDAIKYAFQMVDEKILVKYADSNVITGHIMTVGIQPLIDNALFCIFDISEENRPNIFLELGYAYGKNKYLILTGSKLPEKASDMFGNVVILYNSFKKLKSILTDKLPEIISEAKRRKTEAALSTPESRALLDKDETIPLLELHRTSLQHKILPFLYDYVERLEETEDYYDYKYVFRTVKDDIEESRGYLKGFNNRKVGDIKKFIEQNFTNVQLARIIKYKIEPILKDPTLSKEAKRKKLLNIILIEEKKIFGGFYKKLEDNSEEDKKQ